MNRISSILLITSLFCIPLGCNKDDTQVEPTTEATNTDDDTSSNLIIETLEPNYEGGITATLYGEISENFNFNIQSKGFVYSTDPNPTNEDEIVFVDESSSGVYEKNIYQLNVNTQYYVRAFINYSEGLVYGETKSFSTNDEGFILTNDFISPYMLHNPLDDLIYIFHVSVTLGETDNTNLVAFDYNTGTIKAQKELETTALVNANRSIGIFNSKYELYIIHQNRVDILDAHTLNKNEQLVLDEGFYIGNVHLKNDFIILTASDSSHQHYIMTFDRATLALRSQVKINNQLYKLAVYQETGSDHIICVGFTRTNSHTIHNYIFDVNGTFIEIQYNFDFYLPATELITYNDFSSRIVLGSNALDKEDLYSAIAINNGFTPIDTKFNENGTQLFCIQSSSDIEERSSITVYDGINFNLVRSIPTKQYLNSEAIFIDGNEAITINFEYIDAFRRSSFYAKYNID